MTMRSLAAAVLLSACASGHYLDVEARFTSGTVPADCDAMARQLEERGAWQPQFLFYGPTAAGLYPADEIWVLDIEAWGSPPRGPQDRVLRLDLTCPEDQPLQSMQCPTAEGLRIYVDPRQFTGRPVRGGMSMKCTLRTTAELGGVLHTGFDDVVLRPGLRNKLAPLTRSDAAPGDAQDRSPHEPAAGSAEQ